MAEEDICEVVDLEDDDKQLHRWVPHELEGVTESMVCTECGLTKVVQE